MTYEEQQEFGLQCEKVSHWFGKTKVLRGGAWPTRSRMINSNYRNFYGPERRDVLAGFRTCAV